MKWFGGGFCLAFHSIRETSLTGIARPDIVTSASGFRRTIEEACRIAEPVALSCGKRPRNWFAVTLDDGFRDNVSNALPVLESLSVPATVFVSTGFIRRAVLPYELAIARLVVGEEKTSSGGCEQCARDSARLQLRYADEREPLKAGSADDRAEVLLKLGLTPDVADDIFEQYLDPQELKDLSRHRLINIGSHGCSHLAMTHHSKAVVREELVESRKWLEHTTSVKCQLFAFPYGDYNSSCVRCARRCGYQKVFTTRPQPVRAWNKTVLPRFTCDGLSGLGYWSARIPGNAALRDGP